MDLEGVLVINGKVSLILEEVLSFKVSPAVI